jgi:hypothetical protein
MMLNIEKSNAGRALMERIIADSNGKYEETTNADKSDFKWVAPSSEDSDTYAILKSHKNRVINRYPSIKDLGHKDAFQAMASIAGDIEPDLFSFVPPSFTLPSDKERFRIYQE